MVVEEARNWDIGFVVGVPAWIQLCMEKIIERYDLKTIHDIWPNLAFFVHGGVSFEPYRKGFEKLLGKPLIYIETSGFRRISCISGQAKRAGNEVGFKRPYLF